MPFIEMQGPPVDRALRAELARGATDALVAAFAIRPETVVSTFIDVDAERYAFGGAIAERPQKVFVKVYAFPRPIELRRRAARAMTDAICSASGWEGENVIVYFLEVPPDAAAHAGVLQNDLTN